MNGQLCRRLSIIQLPSVLQEAISWEFVVYQLAVLLNRRLHVFTQMHADECSEFVKPASVTTGKLLMVVFGNTVNTVLEM